MSAAENAKRAKAAAKPASKAAEAPATTAEESGPLRNQLFPIGVDVYPLDE